MYIYIYVLYIYIYIIYIWVNVHNDRSLFSRSLEFSWFVKGKITPFSGKIILHSWLLKMAIEIGDEDPWKNMEKYGGSFHCKIDKMGQFTKEGNLRILENVY